jgi:hypothetical protein
VWTEYQIENVREEDTEEIIYTYKGGNITRVEKTAILGA